MFSQHTIWSVAEGSWRLLSTLQTPLSDPIFLPIYKQRDGKFDDIVIGEDVTVEKLRQALEGRKIEDIKRRGKQMWMVFDQ